MTIHKTRSTDYPMRPEPLRVCVDTSSARQAALDSVTSHCGDCNKSWPGHVIPADHDCRNIRGQDLTEVKRARTQFAAQQLAALRNFAPEPPCRSCGAEMPSGVWHECALAPEPMPHEIAAAQWQRKNGAAALAAELQEIQGDPR